MIRPTPATWFEILSPKDEAILLSAAMARAGCAEFEPATAANIADPKIEILRQRFGELKRNYGGAWPKHRSAPTPHAITGDVLAGAIGRIERWVAAAQPELEALEALHTELAIHEQWQSLLETSAVSAAERAVLAGGHTLNAAIFAGAAFADLVAPPALIARPLVVAGKSAILAIAAQTALDEFGERISALGGRRIAPVAVLANPDPAALTRRLEELREQLSRVEQRLAAIDAEYGIARAVAEAEQGNWCLANVAAVDVRHALCCVTGWTADVQALVRAIDTSGAPALVRFGPPPPDLQAPMLLHNPWWVRPYEVFGRLIGMPERNATDPSIVVAFAFPLLFGYMFGDVGQGLLLVGAGLVCGRRWPLARLFIPGGIAAAGFGLLFGSVFSIHGLLPAWWVDPLEDPLLVLLVPIIGGAALLFIGMALAATAAHWRGEFAQWLKIDGAAAIAFAGVLTGILNSAGFAIATAVILLAAMLELHSTRRLGAFASTLAEIVEKTLQLAINTLSFVRVGAFAVAHAGLSAALGMLVEGAGAAAPLVMVIGNLFIIALEVLVVSIQASRLLLFEFFIRFFTGTGRVFHPAPPPPSETQEPRHEP